MTLKLLAHQEEVKRVVCSVREDAVVFFAKLEFVNQGGIITLSTATIWHFFGD